MQYLTFSLVFAFFVLQLVTIKKELTSNYFVRGRPTGEDWFIHHDEKIALSDARYLYQKGYISVSIWDYLPYPVSSAFGVLYPALLALGFRIFGLNNLGLRFFNLIFCTATNFLLISIINHLISPYVCLLLTVMLLTNWNYFIITRHAIVENVLTFYAVVIVYLFVCHYEIFVTYGFVIGFVSASSVLFKINFPVYLFLLLSAITLGISLKLFTSVLVGFIVGLLIFLSLNLLILAHYSCAKWFLGNLLIVLKVHTGKQPNRDFTFKPLGIRLFDAILKILVSWFTMSKRHLSYESSKFMLFIYFLMYCLLLLLTYMSNPLVMSIWAFILLYQLSLMPFYFYIKRFVLLIPFFFIACSCSMNGVFVILPEVQGLITFALTIFIGVFCVIQFKLGFKMLKNASRNVETFSKEIDSFFQSPQTIFCHCYALRFLWMVKNHRLISGDDNIIYNDDIVDLAIKRQSKYVIISIRDDTKKLKSRTFSPMVFLRPLKIFTTTECDSDTPLDMLLCRIEL